MSGIAENCQGYQNCRGECLRKQRFNADFQKNASRNPYMVHLYKKT